MSRQWRLISLLAISLLLRIDLLGRPFVEYFANRQVQNAIPIRFFQEGRFTLWTLPTMITDTFAVTEFPMLPLIITWQHRLLQILGFAKLPVPGDADAALRYYVQIATLGRLWGLLMSVATMYLLYQFLRQAWSEQAAGFALLWYALLPYNRFFDQLFLAEPTIMALTMLGFHQLWRWVEEEKRWRSYFSSATAFAAVLLLKVSHVMIGIPIAYLFWLRYRRRMLIQWPLWSFAVLVSMPAIYYYFMRGSWLEGSMMEMAFRNTAAVVTDWKFTSGMLTWFWRRHLWLVWTPLGTMLGLVGVIVGYRLPDSVARRLWSFWMVWLLAWLYYWIETGQMSGHLYYQSPSVPIAAGFMGLGTAWLVKRRGVIVRGLVIAAIAAAFFVLNGALQRMPHDDAQDWRWSWDRPPMLAGLAADRLLPPDAKVVAGCNGALQYPMFYYLHRDGWFLSFNESQVDYEVAQADAPTRLEAYREAGAQFYVAAFLNDRDRRGGSNFTVDDFNRLPVGRYLRERYLVVEETDTYIIVDLRSPAGAVSPA